MCGIVGLLMKRSGEASALGEMLAPMIQCMNDRGPDSAGLAVFCQTPRSARPIRRFSLFASDPSADFSALAEKFTRATKIPAEVKANGRYAVLTAPCDRAQFVGWLSHAAPRVHLLASGRSIQMFKDVGSPVSLVDRYHVAQMSGTHAIGHTRMATESAVSPAHAHPFTAGEDFCLVHNGSLSNPYSLRRRLERLGVRFETDNDTEAACRFLEWRMREGDTLEQAIEKGFEELDGFYTLLMATGSRMVLVRDAFACKPAVVAETDDYVAVSSEFRSLAHLPGVLDANVFEPRPRTIYSWSVQ
ncbi:MAG TPA: class II glutamine amidotransferase [Tepidisphaeraceae bacterium]|nr:class II glutamine amidotransferase [Tepidisphaeraceae bacterium]